MKNVLILLFLYSIAPISNAQKANSNYKVYIDDAYLASSIVSYVEEYNIDVKRHVIALNIVTGGKKNVTITNENSRLFKTRHFVPTNYGVLAGNIMFLVYAPVDNLFTRNLAQVRNEIEGCLRDLNIHLEDIEDGVLHKTYSAPVWRLTEESEGYVLNKRVTPYEFDTIPPGYAIVRDSLKRDSIVLIRR